MNLLEILNNVQGVLEIDGRPDLLDVNSVEYDSRTSGKNSVFVAVKGFKQDGHNFIYEAIKNGAEAVVLQDEDAVPREYFLMRGVVRILVEDSRKAIASISNILYGQPSKKIKLIGVTGTKGKTTTSYFIKSVLEFNGYKTGLIGTIKNMIGDREIKTTLTTPQANEINKLLSEMIEEGCKYCVMEVSSVACDLHRVAGLHFSYGVFTNITSDHLDYHGNLQNYFKAKKLFFDNMPSGSKVLLNLKDEQWKTISADTKADRYTFGESETADFEIKNIAIDFNATNYELCNNNHTYRISTSLVGMFNAYNSVSAAAIGVLEGFGINEVIAGISAAEQVSGRFEVIPCGSKRVIVDYAHTADSLEQVLKSIRKINDGKKQIVTVFGCGGDRDKTKRPVMGKIASLLSDYVYITSDNPRTENPTAIIDDILEGVQGKKYTAEPDRAKAIIQALNRSEKDAIILIAGKGHENYQEINGVRTHFSDQEIVRSFAG